MLFDEAYIDRALARVCNDEGATLGTAFFSQAGSGVALTCHHLVPAASETVLLDCGDGKLRPGTVAADDRFPDLDLAIIRGVETPPSVVALPIAAEHQGIARFWTKGFHYHGREITDALPTNGEIEGETSTSFQGFSRDYHLNHVLVLRANAIDAGLSGAPVIDPETGVVFALVNAKFRAGNSTAGLALPFAQAVAQSEKLKQLLAANNDLIPRYGRFLNHLGALEICRGQRERVFNHLSARDIYLSNMYCERAEQSGIDNFYRDKDALILPIIGNAGVGKTMLLAEVASREQSKATMFLLGRSLRPEETDLSIAVTAKLRESADLTAGGDVELLIKALSRAGDRLTIIFDGLNEITAQAFPSLEGWIDRSVTWLEETNTRLIVSSRPEFWQTFASLFPRKRVFSINSMSSPQGSILGMPLGDFTNEEATAVRERYQLDPSIDTRHIQHPLMARIYWELQTELNQRQLIGITRYQALQRFITQKSAKIARATGLLSAHVESYLRDAAGRTLATGGFEIGNQEFFALFSGNDHLAEHFVSEGLFMTTSRGVRFTFDEIGEFIQSKLLDLDAILHQWADAETPSKLSVGAVTYAILRFNEDGNDEFVERATREVFRARRQEARALMAENVFVQLVQELRKPERFAAEIEAAIGELAADPNYHSSWYDRFGLRLAVARSALSLEFKLNLLRPFLLKEDSYDFEHHHWHDLERYVIKNPGHTGGILAELIQSAPLPSFAIMVGWLSDETKLREGKSNMAHAAMALMFFYRHLAFAPLCEVVARSETEKAGLFLSFLSESDPAEVLAVCRQWIERNDPVLLRRAANLAWWMAGQDRAGGEREDKLYEVLSGVIGRVDPEVDAVAKAGIGRLRKYRATVVEDLLSLFRNGAAKVTGYGISELSDTNFEQIALAIKDLIASHPERAAETISALCRQPRSEPELNTLIELMHLGADQGLSRFFGFGFGLEYLLNEVHSEAAVDRMLALARHLLREDKKIAVHLMYFACAAPKEGVAERRLQDQLLDLLVASDIDDRDWQGIIDQLAFNSRTRVGDLKIFQAISSRMSSREFHRVLFGAASQASDFAEILVGWLERPDGISPFGPTKGFLDIVHQGLQPNEAVRQLMDELLSGKRTLE